MQFTSPIFALFVLFVYVVYWLPVGNRKKLQNAVIITAGIIFFLSWDYRFLFLLVLNATAGYVFALLINRSNNQKLKLTIIIVAVVFHLGILSFFKYYHFFAKELADLFTGPFLGMLIPVTGALLPLGISFYTFQILGYVTDVYREKAEPCRSFEEFFCFTAFFPIIISGPIERADTLLPQFSKPREFSTNDASDGLRQFLWGVFKKTVIANGCSVFADRILSVNGLLNGSTLFAGAVFYSVQIYADYSGYSDMAIGTGKFFGITLTQNFRYPYFAKNIADFWQRWHISLSFWLRDYCFIPLSLSLRRIGIFAPLVSTVVIFLISGAWHGATGNYIIWGFLHALCFFPLLINTRYHLFQAKINNPVFPAVWNGIKIMITFSTVTIIWLFFRIEDSGTTLLYLSHIFSHELFTVPYFQDITKSLPVFLFSLFLFITEWFGRHNNHPLERLPHVMKLPVRVVFYYLLIFVIFWFGEGNRKFIYIQF